MNERISEHISYAEAVASQEAVRKGIDNTPGPNDLIRMRIVAEKVFEPLRKAIGKPLHISSFYRCPELNKSIGGSATSQHCEGEAIDISCGEINKEIFYWIKNNLEYDQVIWEFGDHNNPAWVHVSFTLQRPNRQQALIVSIKNGKSQYTDFYE